MNIKSYIRNLLKPDRINELEVIEGNAFDILESYPNGMQDLFDFKKDLFLIRGFLSEAEIERSLKMFALIDDDRLAKNEYGHTYPAVFATHFRGYDDGLEETNRKAQEYFSDCANLPFEFESMFGFDIHSRIEKLFRGISGGRPVDVPKGFNDQGSYPFSNFRYLNPNRGKIPLHCGNYFQDKLAETYSHLIKSVLVENQLSFFIILSNADEGGELDVFSLRWDSGQFVDNDKEDLEVKHNSGKIIRPDSDPKIQKVKLRPNPGDMILFQGGSLWHRVTPIQGDKPRITFGGFIGLNKESGGYSFWT